MVTNDLRVTEASSHSSSTTSFPKASNLEPYGHKIFTIIINSLDTSVIGFLGKKVNLLGNKPTS